MVRISRLHVLALGKRIADMNSTQFIIGRSLLVAAMALTFSLPGQELKKIDLPKPQVVGGKPFMQVVQERKSYREFKADQLELQTLANLLWTAYGINRPDGHRTVPSAMNSQELDLYVVMGEGAYLYDAKANQLVAVKTGDLRSKLSGQAYVKQAPVTLVFVADYNRLVKPRPEEKDFYAAVDVGYASQNVYLFCASENLATVVFALGKNLADISTALDLKPNQKPILAQSIGLPAPPKGK